MRSLNRHSHLDSQIFWACLMFQSMELNFQLSRLILIRESTSTSLPSSPHLSHFRKFNIYHSNDRFRQHSAGNLSEELCSRERLACPMSLSIVPRLMARNKHVAVQHRGEILLRAKAFRHFTSLLFFRASQKDINYVISLDMIISISFAQL